VVSSDEKTPVKKRQAKQKVTIVVEKKRLVVATAKKPEP